MLQSIRNLFSGYKKPETVKVYETYFFGFKIHRSEEFFDDLNCWIADDKCSFLCFELFRPNIFNPDGTQSYNVIFGRSLNPADIQTDEKGQQVCINEKIIHNFQEVLNNFPPFLKMSLDEQAPPRVVCAYIEKD